MRFWEFSGRVLSLEPTVFSTLEVDPAALVVAFALCPGLSDAAGQSVVLFVSCVTPRRFAFSLLLSSVPYVFSFAVLVLSVWLGAVFFPGCWPIMANSAWKRARAKELITFVPLGPCKPTGLKGYVGAGAFLPDRRSYLEGTLEPITRIVASVPSQQSADDKTPSAP